MGKLESMKKNSSQEERNEVLVTALNSQNSMLIEMALELEPDIAVGGERLLKYAISSCNMKLLKELLEISKITQNEDIMWNAVYLAMTLDSIAWFDILNQLFEKGGSKDAALTIAWYTNRHTLDFIMWLVKQGAKIRVLSYSIKKRQCLVEKIFEQGYGKSLHFVDDAFEEFGNNLCKSNKQNVVKRTIQDRPDLVHELNKIAVTGGYTEIVKIL